MTRHRRLAAEAVSSVTRRLLPAPASPIRTTTRPRPANASSSSFLRRATFGWRPTSGGSHAGEGSVSSGRDELGGAVGRSEERRVGKEGRTGGGGGREKNNRRGREGE